MDINDKIEQLSSQNSDEEKLYETLSEELFSKYPWEKKDLGEGMSVISQVIWEYWKPRFILNDKTKCAYEFMNCEEYLVTVTKDDIDWKTLEGLSEKAIEVAEALSFHYPSFIHKYENGVAEVSWQLNPDGMYFMDDDGFGMTNDKEIKVYGFIDKTGKVLVKFQIIKDYDELDVMRAMAEKVLAGNEEDGLVNNQKEDNPSDVKHDIAEIESVGDEECPFANNPQGEEIITEFYIVRCGPGNSIHTCIYAENNFRYFEEHDIKNSHLIGRKLSNENITAVLHGRSVNNSDFANVLEKENKHNLMEMLYPTLCEVDKYVERLREKYCRYILYLFEYKRIEKDDIILEFMMNKAKEFVDSINSYATSQKIIIVSNPLFCRCLESVIKDKPIADVTWMDETEYRHFTTLRTCHSMR